MASLLSYCHKCFSHLGYFSNLFSFFAKVKHNNFVDIAVFLIFLASVFEKSIPKFRACHNCFCVLLANDFPSHYFLFHGAILSRTFLQEIAKL